MNSEVWLPILAGFSTLVIIYSAVCLPGKLLQQKFQSLGDLKGMTKASIIARCGRYKSSHTIDRGTVCVWMATDYKISIVFDADNRAIQVITRDTLKKFPGNRPVHHPTTA